MSPPDDLETAAARTRPPLLAEVWRWLARTGQWWLAPIVLTLLLLGAFVVLASSGAGPFLYALF